MARFFFVAVLLVAALFAVTADAYKSVRYRRPKTPEEREEHHKFHRRRPQKETGDHTVKHDHIHGDFHSFHKSNKYHHKFGPEYPDHTDKFVDHQKQPMKNQHGHVLESFMEAPEHHPDFKNSRVL